MLKKKTERGKASKALAAVAIAFVVAVPQRGTAQSLVFDLTNLVQNVISAVQNVQAVVQQASQLVNEAEIIANQVEEIEQLVAIVEDLAKNSTSGTTGTWGEVETALDALARAIRVGDALSYDLADLSTAFEERFPGYEAPEDYRAAYEAWSKASMDTLRGTLVSAGQNVGDASSVESALRRLKSANESTEGRLEAIQVGNELASLEIEELAKLRQLLAAQITSQNTYLAAETSRRAGADAAFTEFLRTGEETSTAPRPAEGLGIVPRP